MANQKRKAKNNAPSDRHVKMKNRPLLIGLGLLLLLLSAGIITMFLYGQHNQEADFNTNNNKRPVTIIISIIYPDLQDNGQIVYTNTLIETEENNLYDVIEKELSDKIHFTYDETGTLLTAGRLQPQNGEKLKILQNTARERIDLGSVPSTVSLEDGATYEIMLAGTNGEQLYQTTAP